MCQQLGFNTVDNDSHEALTPEKLDVVEKQKTYSRPTEIVPLWLDNVLCTGDERVLVDWRTPLSRKQQRAIFGSTTCKFAFGVNCSGNDLLLRFALSHLSQFELFVWAPVI